MGTEISLRAVASEATGEIHLFGHFDGAETRAECHALLTLLADGAREVNATPFGITCVHCLQHAYAKALGELGYALEPESSHVVARAILSRVLAGEDERRVMEDFGYIHRDTVRAMVDGARLSVGALRDEITGLRADLAEARRDATDEEHADFTDPHANIR